MSQQPQQTSAKRASTRYSTFSITPTLAPSIAPSHLSVGSDDDSHHNEKYNHSKNDQTSPMAQDMSAVHATLARLEEPRLTSQRYVVSEGKREEISKLALGAKLERALGRRMSSQDASFTKGKNKATSERSAGVAVKASAA
ncbi:hypothetical protein BT63DRAFT_216143 [Microthyrium microscopicum]|uniref:Uncharacterized protein n=1 Tax=Microthyrium microscopicum TaxID=703497 RepID=A0A6A6UGL2_9PEZI|nr:hypothetical protein BT63DRAFT_216143 [Microthyrium microscopicum]